MNLNESLSEWVQLMAVGKESLDGVEILTMGDTDDISPPSITIMESGVSQVEQGGTILYGVGAYEITVQLHTIPAELIQGGTPKELHQEMRFDLFDILGNREAIEFVNGRNFWQVFDIRTTPPNTEVQEGRTVSTFQITVIACQQ
jgi:hypothetical protein